MTFSGRFNWPEKVNVTCIFKLVVKMWLIRKINGATIWQLRTTENVDIGTTT